MLLVSRGRKGGWDIKAVAETDPPPVSRKITETDRQTETLKLRDRDRQTQRNTEAETDKGRAERDRKGRRDRGEMTSERERETERQTESTQNSQIYDSRIEILSNSLHLQSVLAKLHRQHTYRLLISLSKLTQY